MHKTLFGVAVANRQFWIPKSFAVWGFSQENAYVLCYAVVAKQKRG